jgi:hypothetical protein
MSVIIMGIGIVLTWDRERNYVNLMFHVFLSWGMFVIVAYADLFKRQMLIIGIVLVVVSTFVSVLILGRKIKRNGDTRQVIIRRRVRNVISVWRRNLSIASLVLVVPIGVSMLFNGTVMCSDLEVAKVYGEEHSFSVNIDVICNIAPERWENLDVQSKLNVCQAIINAQAAEYYFDFTRYFSEILSYICTKNELLKHTILWLYTLLITLWCSTNSALCVIRRPQQ